MSDGIGIISAIACVILAAAMSAGLIVVLHPLLKRYAVAKPNSRSSHRAPTPQGGGIAVIAATLVVAFLALYFSTTADLADRSLLTVCATAILVAGLGVADDIFSVGVVPRLLLQALAVAAAIYALPHELRVVPPLPWWIERILLVIGGLWFVNLVNFMDGLDWMTAAEIVPVTAALATIGGLGGLPSQGTAIAVALCGALIGFGYFNRPTAKLFLGDVGSLPIGLLTGWLLLLLATRGHLVAAVLLPLYYLADATITLFRRMARGERIWQAHRTHFYQLATDRGFSSIEIVSCVFALNVILCSLAIWTVVMPGRLSHIAALIGGVVLVAGLLSAFAHGKNKR
jgi:UDP-N-acetylmuramyl pentapeptide phosphotransferase/UDP-N-acetylglucosamine-1-phosphate transferase